MSPVAEIQAAIENLPPADYRALLAWIDEHRSLLGASEAIFGMYDHEEEARAEGDGR